MLETAKALAFDFLQQKIDSKFFVQSCVTLYRQSLHNPKSNYELDSILVIPFIHAFAYGHLSEMELKSEVMRFHGILCGMQVYHYSAFIKLLPHIISDKLPVEIQENIHNLPPAELVTYFSDRIASPVTVYDLIHNAIVDLLSIAGFYLDDEAECSLINCDKDMITEQINQKLVKLLSCFIGNDTILLQVNCSSYNRIEYIVS